MYMPGEHIMICQCCAHVGGIGTYPLDPAGYALCPVCGRVMYSRPVIDWALRNMMFARPGGGRHG